MILITGVVLLIGVIGFFVSRNPSFQQIMQKTGGSTAETSNVTPAVADTSMQASTIVERAEPWIEVVSSDNKTTYAVNDTITLSINGFSKGKDITGYDILLPIDTSMFEVVRITSTKPGFSIFEFDKGTHRTITGIKDVGTKDVTAFDSTPLVSVVLKAKKQGTSTIAVSEADGNEKTQFVDSEVNVLIPQKGGLQIVVQ
jgi:hypothetical protein